MDLNLLARAYDRSAEGYDERFRALQREKYRAMAAALPAAPREGVLLDAGAGTALFAEWLADPAEPHAELRAKLRNLRCVALDASRGMLQHARGRAVLPVVADLAVPPLRPSSCALVVAFTALLDRVPQALAALSALLQPGAVIVLSFLRDEAPPLSKLSRAAALHAVAGPLPAGQDLLFLLARS